MEYYTIITQWLLSHIEWVLLGLSATILGALVIFIKINLKLSRMLKKYDVLTQGMAGKNLEGILFEHIERMEGALVEVTRLKQQCDGLAETTELCLQKVGVVRFNAFTDMGSNLSFSVAILDANDNGLIISSLFGRDESRVYGKPVQDGKSQYLLTDEEQEALRMAQRK